MADNIDTTAIKKTCSHCHQEKELSLFHKDKRRPDQLTVNCKACRCTYRMLYYQLNKDKILARKREYRLANIEKCLTIEREEHKKYRIRSRKNSKDYWIRNKEKLLQMQSVRNKRKRVSDTQYRLSCVLRERLNKVLRGKQKLGSAVNDLGCTVEYLVQHIESQFQPGMSWSNWGKHGWHIDHIRPLSSFNLENKEEFLAACSYKNLQPMWAEENLKKGDRYNGNR